MLLLFDRKASTPPHSVAAPPCASHSVVKVQGLYLDKQKAPLGRVGNSTSGATYFALLAAALMQLVDLA